MLLREKETKLLVVLIIEQNSVFEPDLLNIDLTMVALNLRKRRRNLEMSLRHGLAKIRTMQGSC